PARLAGELAKLPFVARIELVPVARPMRRIEDPADAGGILSEPPAAPGIAGGPGDPSFYGGSFKQLDMMQVPALHALGLSGAGVLVCMLDTGFTLTHEAFIGLNVVAKRDFIHGDLNVDDQPGQDASGQANHGTLTLGCVAGYKAGTYLGGAYAASVALAKTENIASETPVEMDYWQFAAEWADSLGADVISSSLGYSEFDNPGDSYGYADMDGRTTVVTLAAAEAARRGITVVNAAGNEGGNSWFFIIAPGDADTVITSGAVDSTNVVASFSSHGPTSDGRIKPDVTAMGRSVLCVNRTVSNAYVRASGTSFSTPLTAGLVALLLESHPTWSPLQVREALRQTALNHAAPNNTIGWGLVQGLAANAYSSVLESPPPPVATGVRLAAGPNPLPAGTPGVIRFTVPAGGRATLDLVDVSGRRRARLFDGPAAGEHTIAWVGMDAEGGRLTPGIYWLRLVQSGSTAAAATLRIAVLP
ncbi:MAG TPA: S8 family serine peptidase, partial [Candidatus Eisenbacteria bacterium]|nr:S8 family serine peptidase [Candidatus Eisenbacteria bacterium]